MGVTMEYGNPLTTLHYTTWVVEHVELSIGKTNTHIHTQFLGKGCLIDLRGWRYQMT